MKHVQMEITAISYGQNTTKEEQKMNNTIEALKIRIHQLQERDPVGNANLINKLKRRVRALENK